jgi:osmotically-inducible protein OsmY
MQLNVTGTREMMTMTTMKALSASLLAVLLITAAGCAGSSTRESTGEYIDDTWITTKVKAALIDDSVVRAREVNVETFKGVVQLSGFVSSKEAMDKAVVIARNIDGVTSVKNDMQIK